MQPHQHHISHLCTSHHLNDIDYDGTTNNFVSGNEDDDNGDGATGNEVDNDGDGQ